MSLRSKVLNEITNINFREEERNCLTKLIPKYLNLALSTGTKISEGNTISVMMRGLLIKKIQGKIKQEKFGKMIQTNTITQIRDLNLIRNRIRENNILGKMNRVIHQNR